jgi:diacylglycerol O-acyltransferase
MSDSRLSALDASFFRVESPNAHMHVAWKGRFAPRDADEGGTAVTIDALRACVAARLRHAPRFRQRVAFPPAGLGEPVWVDDERFDVAAHVVPMGAPGEAIGERRFDDLCDDALSAPLDRTRALWRIEFAERMDDGGCGLLMKIHHAMVDGKSAVELALLLLDLSPDAEHGEPEAWTPAPAPGMGRLAIDALADSGRE